MQLNLIILKKINPTFKITLVFFKAFIKLNKLLEKDYIFNLKNFS